MGSMNTSLLLEMNLPPEIPNVPDWEAHIQSRCKTFAGKG